MDGLYNCINYVSGRASALPYCNIIPSNGKHTPRGCNMYCPSASLLVLFILVNVGFTRVFCNNFVVFGAILLYSGKQI